MKNKNDRLDQNELNDVVEVFRLLRTWRDEAEAATPFMETEETDQDTDGFHLH